MARPRSRSPKKQPGQKPSSEVRRYRVRNVDVEIREASLGLRGSRSRDNRVELRLDGTPIDVEMVDGQYHCQLANQFTAFASMDEVVDTLLANEGRTWTLHGFGRRATSGGHGHGGGGGHDRGPVHDHGRGGGR